MSENTQKVFNALADPTRRDIISTLTADGARTATQLSQNMRITRQGVTKHLNILIEAQSNADQEKRNELYKKAQEIIKEDAPWIPLAHSTPILAGSSSITGFMPHPTGSDILTKVEFK